MDRRSLARVRSRPARSKLVAFGLVMLIGGILLGACGGSTSASNGSTSTSTSTSTGSSSGTSSSGSGGSGVASASAFASCLQKHGVTLPRRTGVGGAPSGTRPSGSGGGFNPASLPTNVRDAFSACAKYRPAGGNFGRGENSTALAAYRNCLKLHGVSFPARPTTSAGAGASSSTTVTTVPTAKVQAALSACAALRPKGFGAQSGAGSATSSSSAATAAG
ncbi:MAG TPA: hypothetical protein VMU75_11250 [Acidimicrobiales bacterium]|nr:hypothetical protein [Acidimicrobiales bacterium]